MTKKIIAGFIVIVLCLGTGGNVSGAGNAASDSGTENVQGPAESKHETLDTGGGESTENDAGQSIGNSGSHESAGSGGRTDGSESTGGSGSTDGGESTGSAGENGDLTGMGEILEIDDENIYDGMAVAYKDGYIPEVENDKAVIILPLCLKIETEITSVKAVPNLGSPETAPFIFKNYQKTIPLTLEKVNDGDFEQKAFLVRFELDLKSERQNGVYPVEISVDYMHGDMPVTQNFSVYIEITDGKSPENETEPVVNIPETEEKPTSEPKIIIKKCKNIPEKIETGSTFSIVAVLENTNKLKYVQNMTVTVSCATEGISLQADSNVFYFEHLGAQKELEVPLSFKVEEGAAAGKYTVSLEMSYDNPDAVSLSSTGRIELSVSQKNVMALETGDSVGEVNAGDSLKLPIQALNLGRSKAYNVRCSVDVPGLSARQSLFLGNMEGGSAASGEITAFAGMVNPDAESDAERYGRTYGRIIMTYEDENGDSYTIDKEIALEILPLKISASDTETEEDAGIGWELIVSGCVLVAVMAAAAIVPAVIYKVKKRKLHEQ